MSPQQNQNQGQGGRGGGQGRNRGGRGGGQPKCQKCLEDANRRQNPNVVPKDRQFCYTCAPELTVEVNGQHGASGYEVVVRTFENGVPKAMSFSYAIEGEGWKADHTEASNPQAPDNAKVLTIQYVDKDRDVGFIVGGDTQTITVPTDPSKKVDKAKVKGLEIIATVTRQRTSAQVFVQTLKDGKLAKLPFFYNVDRTGDFICVESADGAKLGEPEGTCVIPIGSYARPRKARFWIVGNPQPVEVTIDPEPGCISSVEVVRESECLITADVSQRPDENRHDVLVQTYVDGVQASARFYYQVEGGAFQFSQTHDGEIGAGVLGTRVIEIPGSPEARRLFVGFIGKNVDVINTSEKKGVDLPAIPVKSHMTKANHKKSARRNFLAALRGE